jgi:3-oxoacyl-[acyl-carrier protein] reductase
MEIQFSGKTVLVTGAAHGIGRGISLEFARRGAHVWICDVLPDALEETRQICLQAGGSCEARIVDITRHDAVHAWGQEAVATSGRADVLVNNAGGVQGQAGKPLEEVSPQEWQRIFDVNVSGAFYACQAVTPAMKQQHSGRIINISSGAGLGISLTGIQAYASAKAALINLTRQLAHELGPSGITVNSIAPGFLRSNPASEKQWQSYGEEGQRRLLENIAMRRLGQPQDIAYGVLFLASEYASWVSGQILSIDGGK